MKSSTNYVEKKLMIVTGNKNGEHGIKIGMLLKSLMLASFMTRIVQKY